MTLNIETIKNMVVQKDTLGILKLVKKINGVKKINSINGRTDIGTKFVTEKNNPKMITMFKSILSRMPKFISRIFVNYFFAMI